MTETTVEQPTHCPHCGAGLKAFWHLLSPGLVSGLIEAIRAVHWLGKNEFHLQRDLTLTKNQYANFAKLRFHGLIARVDDKPGYWLITNRGGAFLRGEMDVPLRVQTFRNRVIGHSEERINIRALRGKVPEFEQSFAYEIKPVEPKVEQRQQELFVA